MNKQRTVSVFRYALAVAAREDDRFRRQLGPIHLLKYAYLVDLNYAKYHSGETFTGIEWKFHSFGPWSTAAHALIAVSMATTGIQENRISSNYGDDDYFRWIMNPEESTEPDIGADLPLDVRGTLDNFVHRFAANTPAILHYVYTTSPILHAKPGEMLDFPHSTLQEPPKPEAPFVPLMDRLTKTQKEEFTTRMFKLRSDFERRQAESEAHCSRFRQRADDDFAETAEWVNSLAGMPFPNGEVKVEFDESVWRSQTRQGHVIS